MARRHIFALAALLALAAGVCLASQTAAESMVRIVRISFLARRVRTEIPPGRWSTALLNSPVLEGERIRTAADGQAEVQLECGSALRLTPNSELSVEHLRMHADGVRDTVVKVESGTMYFSLRSGDTRDLRIDVPGGQVDPVDGAVRLRLSAPVGVANTPLATVEVLDGRAELMVGKRQTHLAKADEVAIRADARVAEVPDAPADQWSRWSHNRDLAFQRAMNMNAPPPPPIATAVETIPASSDPPTVPHVDDPSIFNGMDAHVGANADPFLTRANLRKVPACGN